jgi:hypothetical protein
MEHFPRRVYREPVSAAFTVTALRLPFASPLPRYQFMLDAYLPMKPRYGIYITSQDGVLLRHAVTFSRFTKIPADGEAFSSLISVRCSTGILLPAQPLPAVISQA